MPYHSDLERMLETANRLPKRDLIEEQTSACFCVGPQAGESVCPCELRRINLMKPPGKTLGERISVFNLL